MEDATPMNGAQASKHGDNTVDYNTQLLDVIIGRLELISEKGKESVLEYIEGLVDMEERQLEFDRRQGRLYTWPVDDTRA